jgi:hypothetical protein
VATIETIALDKHNRTDFDIISFVVVTALSEQPMGNHLMDIQLVEDRVCILIQRSGEACLAFVSRRKREVTLLKLAVKTTTS